MAGIVDTIKLAGILVLAIPAALAGLELLVRGETVIGSILVGLAVALVIFQRRLTPSIDIPGRLAKRVGSVVMTSPEEAKEGDEGDEERAG